MKRPWLTISRMTVGMMLAVAACGPAAPPEIPDPDRPTGTSTPDQPPPDGSDPFVVDALLREEALPLLKGPQPTFNEVALAASLPGVPAAPATCDAFVKRAAATKRQCPDKPRTLAVLDEAMAIADVAKRDQILVEAEACPGLEAGLVRALRVELAPPECGDVLAEPVLKAKPAGMSGAVQHALVGHALAARLTRTVSTPPVLAPPYEKKRVDEFTKKTLWPWYQEQKKAVETLTIQSKELGSYGKGVAALASGWAHLRLVEVVREAPIPDDFRKDPDLANNYFIQLDVELDPTKNNGRNGVLVALGTMAQTGVLADERVRKAKALLAKLYNGSKVDAYEALALPALPDAASTSIEQRLAATLPTFITGLLIDPTLAVSDAGLLRSLLRRGIPTPMRAALKEADATLTDEVRALYARGRLEMGFRYWRAVDFDTSVALFSKVSKSGLSPTDRLVFAVAIATRNGPEDVAVMMFKGAEFSPKFGDVRALDRVVAEATDPGVAGLAAYDAAVIRQIGAPFDADAAFWEALEQRYRNASSKLTDQKTRYEADERAKAAAAFAKIRKTEKTD